MKLEQVKSLLHQTKCGEMFMDGMGCSEPILTQDSTGLIDNFFVYLIDKKQEQHPVPWHEWGYTQKVVH